MGSLRCIDPCDLRPRCNVRSETTSSHNSNSDTEKRCDVILTSMTRNLRAVNAKCRSSWECLTCVHLESIIKSCYDSAHICPIRAEISTYEHWENVFILLFVWLVVMGFRQNYFHISHNVGDFGAKMSFFRYIINQKLKIFIKHCSPPRVPKHHLYQRCVSI